MSEFWAYDGADMFCVVLLSILCVICLLSARFFVKKL